MLNILKSNPSGSESCPAHIAEKERNPKIHINIS